MFSSPSDASVLANARQILTEEAVHHPGSPGNLSDINWDEWIFVKPQLNETEELSGNT